MQVWGNCSLCAKNTKRTLNQQILTKETEVKVYIELKSFPEMLGSVL